MPEIMQALKKKIMKKFLLVNSEIMKRLYCVKNVRIRSFSGPYFPALGLSTGKCEKVKLEYGHFSRSAQSHLFKFNSFKHNDENNQTYFQNLAVFISKEF